MIPDYSDLGQQRKIHANNIPKPTRADGGPLNYLYNKAQAGVEPEATARRPIPVGTPQVAVDPGRQQGQQAQASSPVLGTQRRQRPEASSEMASAARRDQGGPQSIQGVIELIRQAGRGGHPVRRPHTQGLG